MLRSNYCALFKKHFQAAYVVTVYTSEGTLSFDLVFKYFMSSERFPLEPRTGQFIYLSELI